MLYECEVQDACLGNKDSEIIAKPISKFYTNDKREERYVSFDNTTRSIGVEFESRSNEIRIYRKYYWAITENLWATTMYRTTMKKSTSQDWVLQSLNTKFIPKLNTQLSTQSLHWSKMAKITNKMTITTKCHSSIPSTESPSKVLRISTNHQCSLPPSTHKHHFQNYYIYFH